MVGVSYLIFIYFIHIAYCNVCPTICTCLGNYVHCDKKHLPRVPDNLPEWAIELNLNNNLIQKVTGDNWKKLKNLTELKLNKNQIRVITKDTFNNLERLQLLDLNRNLLQNVTAFSFKSLESLTTLKLRRNTIVQLRDGAFFGLKNIQTLMLDYNHVEVISKGWLYGLTTLKDLSMSNNRINQIDPEAWEFCSQLIKLDLANNQLKIIKRDTFKDLASLKKLVLTNNNITVIEEGAFTHTPKLEVLYLNENQIAWLIEDGNGVFRSLSYLRQLMLLNNNIKTIHKKAFDGLKNMKIIDLMSNNITSIQNGAFNDMQLLQDLKIDTPTLLCDCNLDGFVTWLTAKNIRTNAICNYPKTLRGQKLFNVSASNLMCEDHPKPRLTDEPDSEIMALKGGNITLSCSAFSSSPSPMTFAWKKGNVEMTDGTVTNSTVATDDKSVEIKSELTIYNVQHSNAGKYQCVVSNRYGTTYSQKASIAVLIYPTFLKIPSNVTVQGGSTVKLECAASGEPPAEIAWQKDGGNDFPAARERRMHVMPTDDAFFIVNAKPADMGVYSCIAHNIAGTIVANATLTIEEKPSFVKPMIDKEVTAGESVVMQCMAGGTPKPSIEWSKDGIIIRATDRHFFTAEDQLMIVVDTSLGDAGTYYCNLNNSLGQVSASSILSVKPKGITDSDKMGIIIITVVCCAVCTSIIWVVIIYQTRRRMAPLNSTVLQLETTMMTYPEQATNQFTDNVSEHSSCKDSGTGDSAKRSNDDLLPESEYTLMIDGVNPNDKCGSMRRASLVYLTPEANRINTPLLHSDAAYQVSTNHDRLLNNINEIEVEVSPSTQEEETPDQ